MLVLVLELVLVLVMVLVVVKVLVIVAVVLVTVVDLVVKVVGGMTTYDSDVNVVATPPPPSLRPVHRY